MTSILEQAIRQTAALPEREQEWERQFAASHEMLVSMADKALAEYEAGLTAELAG